MTFENRQKYPLVVEIQSGWLGGVMTGNSDGYLNIFTLSKLSKMDTSDLHNSLYIGGTLISSRHLQTKQYQKKPKLY